MANFEKILLVDDEPNSLKGLGRYLSSLDYDVLEASTAKTALEILANETPDLVISDIRMPEMTGLDLLDRLNADWPRVKVILMTAYGSVEDAVKAMKRGAFYYLTKPVNLDELELLVKKAFSSRQLEEENLALRQELFASKFSAGKMIGHSKVMKDLEVTLEKIAKSSASVLIEGESGTGKELIAHRLHNLSPRAAKPFVAVHCAALTDTLLTSELFGHEKGAFTGAAERKQGRFERAHHGTLFLDEIGEISKDTQVKLLRVLQEGEFERVGGTKTIHVDVRVVAATNKNLIEEVRAGRFREDLYYRLNVIYLKVPPLRERKDDIPVLAKAFTDELSRANGKRIDGIDAKALELLQRYDWPGNIRELRNILERMIVLAPDEKSLSADLVPEDLKQTGLSQSASEFSSLHIQDVEKELIEKALIKHRGNKSLAAETLGISRRTLYRKLEEYDIPS